MVYLALYKRGKLYRQVLSEYYTRRVNDIYAVVVKEDISREIFLFIKTLNDVYLITRINGLYRIASISRQKTRLVRVDIISSSSFLERFGSYALAPCVYIIT